jgi:hypothetical protein
MITENQYIESANYLGVDVATIKAVADVESTGNGFLPSGEPKILFEPHVFWQQLIKLGIDPKKIVKGNEDILYPKWGTKPYGKVSEQHIRLERATHINRDAALMSASWGRFQIMGHNYKSLQYESLQDFINAMYKNEDEHLKAFVKYVEVNNLVGFLQNKDWTNFAKGYNGPSYAKNKYPEKLAKAYEKFK